jgi:anaerobic selenocysteine-containing dehydrogenase
VSLFGELGRRMGFAESCFHDTADDLIAQALGKGAQELKTKKRIRQHAGAEEFRDGTFATPSGKIEFYSTALAAQGSDPLPTFHAPEESRRGTKAHEFPLEFLPRKADNYMNSTFANLPGHQKMECPGLAMMHVHDAEARRIEDGDWVEVFNARGNIRLRARLDGSVPAGVVAASLNWNKLSPGGNNVNALTSERLTDLGRGATFYSTLVEVRKLSGEEAQNGFPPID